jgi:FlaA1/EpsC-like NDP-sugar epimerase
MKVFENKTVVITGGTGSLGKVLTRRLLRGTNGLPKKIIILSRDEAKQHFMRMEYKHASKATDEVIYHNFDQLLEFRIGDVRDYAKTSSTLKGADVVINAAALKQVPSCEYFPFEASLTNVIGAENIVRAIHEHELPVETVVGVSTDKACKPVNVMGMTKALQERIFIAGNILNRQTRHICVRYGNVMASRGSVIPLFHEQIRKGGPVTLTTKDMTRFLLPLEKAVDTICAAIKSAKPGETYVPRAPAARMIDIARAMIGDRDIGLVTTGIRPGEKIHEIMVSDEEAVRTVERGEYYAIKPMLPELLEADELPALSKEYSSADSLLSLDETRELLASHHLLVNDEIEEEGEILR